jgi:hypothetical protein
MSRLAQFGWRRHAERHHKMTHLLPIGAPRLGAPLLLQPDFFLGDRG